MQASTRPIRGGRGVRSIAFGRGRGKEREGGSLPAPKRGRKGRGGNTTLPFCMIVPSLTFEVVVGLMRKFFFFKKGEGEGALDAVHSLGRIARKGGGGISPSFRAGEEGREKGKKNMDCFFSFAKKKEKGHTAAFSEGGREKRGNLSPLFTRGGGKNPLSRVQSDKTTDR